MRASSQRRAAVSASENAGRSAAGADRAEGGELAQVGEQPLRIDLDHRPSGGGLGRSELRGRHGLGDRLRVRHDVAPRSAIAVATAQRVEQVLVLEAGLLEAVRPLLR
jgi:hypothetical protein